MEKKKEQHIDPLRFPKVQAVYEKDAERAFSSKALFGDVVETMVNCIKTKK